MNSGAAVEYTQETSYVPGAAVVAEGALKPETVLTFVNKLATVKTTATWTKVSIQSLADAPDLQRWLDAAAAQRAAGSRKPVPQRGCA